MARDPYSRHELRRRLEEAIGPEATDTLMEAMWDLDQFEERMSLRMEATEHRIVAAFRAELLRTVVVSQVGTVLAVATAIIAAAKLL